MDKYEITIMKKIQELNITKQCIYLSKPFNSFTFAIILFILFIFDKNIPTLVERSQLNFSGGISVFIPSRLSGKIIKLSLDKSKRIFFILSKY